MVHPRVLFSDEETTKFVVIGPSYHEFSLGELHSSEVFPKREYFLNGKVEDCWTLRALHTRRDGKVSVLVWTANN